MRRLSLKHVFRRSRKNGTHFYYHVPNGLGQEPGQAEKSP